jgi:DNA-3-methyladenine glycosylase II
MGVEASSTMTWRAAERRGLRPLSDPVPAKEAIPRLLHTRSVAAGRHGLNAAEARWENEGGAEDGRDPSELHRRTISINPPPPFRLDLSAWALRRRPGNAMDVWDGSSYRRALALTDGEVELRVTQEGGPETPRLTVALVESRLGRCGEPTGVSALERLLGLRVDLSDFYLMAARDSVIGPLVARFRGVKPPRFPTVFESLVNAVANQQLSLESGLSLLNRLAASYGRSVTMGPGPLHAFPRPQDLAGLEPQALCDLGFSGRKATTIVEISRAVVTGRLDLESLDSLADDEVVSQLTSLSGIGRWSAEYVLLRGLGRLHVFPGDDVGARNNLAQWLALKPPLDYTAVGNAVARWQPYAGMVYFHLLLARLEGAGHLDRAQVAVR